uniref:Uncharacterized protein n=1 Tax=Rhizophora mucronata TaxID=61149 RepID=A0A2P2IJW8_RHIMU
MLVFMCQFIRVHVCLLVNLVTIPCVGTRCDVGMANNNKKKL